VAYDEVIQDDNLVLPEDSPLLGVRPVVQLLHHGITDASQFSELIELGEVTAA